MAYQAAKKKTMGGSVFVIMDTLSSGPPIFFDLAALWVWVPPTMVAVSFGN
jgi:hypothetical protein